MIDQYADIDLEDLESQSAKLPAQIAYVGTLLASAELEAGRAKLVFKQTEARLYKTYRLELEASKSRTTETMIESEVISDSDYTQSFLAYEMAQVEVTKVKMLLEALRAKKDMLVSICAGKRAEASTWK